MEKDRLSHLFINSKGKVEFDHLQFELRGTADSWLQSPSFGAIHPGSGEAERALRKAKALLKKPNVTIVM